MVERQIRNRVVVRRWRLRDGSGGDELHDQFAARLHQVQRVARTFVKHMAFFLAARCCGQETRQRRDESGQYVGFISIVRVINRCITLFYN